MKLDHTAAQSFVRPESQAAVVEVLLKSPRLAMPLPCLQKTPLVSLVSIEMTVGLFDSHCRMELEKSAELVFNCKLTPPMPLGAECDALKLLRSAAVRVAVIPHSNCVFISKSSV